MADIFIVTGEASGDAIGAGVAEHLLRLRPGVTLEGIGAARMEAAGVRLWANSADWAAIGVSQALPMYARMLALQRRLKRALAANPPKTLALVDFGAFNVPLGAFARRHGIRTVYMMPPGSWRRHTRLKRLLRLARAADLFLTPFPWNVENLKSVGAEAAHIGHPALDLSVPTARADALRAHRRPGGRLIALLPGSRRHEVETLAPMMASVVRGWPHEEDRFLMARAPSFTPEAFTAILADANVGAAGERLHITDAGAADVFAACDLAVVCSGTATLEAAVAGTPMVVVYDGPRVMRAEWRLRKRWLKIQHIALPNIIAGRSIVPELMADDAGPASVAAALGALATDATRRDTMRADLAAVRRTLEPTGALNAAAEHILEGIPT